MKQHYLQLAHNYDGRDPTGWYLSEKLDGQRAFWDGGISRGVPVADVPYANRSKDKRNHVATGLWSRYGKPIFAPKWFLNQLPEFACDGELWGGYGKFQQTTGTVRSLNRSVEWLGIKFMVFDAPPISVFLAPRFIDVPTATFSVYGTPTLSPGMSFSDRRHWVAEVPWTRNLYPVQHYQCVGREHLEEFAEKVAGRGGEGVMLRSPADYWKTERCDTLLKYKPVRYGTGKVVGTTPGKGRHEGRIGALIIESEHGQFQIGTGLTDYQRTLSVVGATIKFSYETLTNSGIPRNARCESLSLDKSE